MSTGPSEQGAGDKFLVELDHPPQLCEVALDGKHVLDLSGSEHLPVEALNPAA